MSEFARVTAVVPDGDRRFAATLDPGWAILGKPNGGYLLAVVARAASRAAGDRTPLAVSGHFLRAPDPGPVAVETEVRRSGRRSGTVAATLWQGDRRCLDTLVTVGDLGEATAGARPPWLVDADRPHPGPDGCVSARSDAFPVELLERIDVRLTPETSPLPRPSGRPHLMGWARLVDDADLSPLDRLLALLVVVDALPPTVFNLGRLAWAPTVELTVLLRGVPQPGWLAVEVGTELVAASGWYDEQAAVHDTTGRLLAQSRQLALAPPT